MKPEYRILEDGTIHIYSSWRVRKNAKKNYELGLNTYKGKGRTNWKETLRNTIQPDDWKGGSFRDDL